MRRHLVLCILAALLSGCQQDAADLGKAPVTADNPEGLPYVQLLYVLPSDGVEDASMPQRIRNSSLAWESWLANETGGRALRLRMTEGAPDVQTFRLAKTDAEVAARGPQVRDEIEAQVLAAGFPRRGVVYAAYYDGTSTYACGGGAWPPSLPGVLAAQYLRGRYDGVDCSLNAVGDDPTTPGYQDFAMLHEVMHTLGIVATCAPNHTRAGHTSEDPNDLMYAGDEAWWPTKLDVGNDDYFQTGRSGCADLAESPLLAPWPPA